MDPTAPYYEERLDRLESIVEHLAEAQVRADERLERLEAAVERLVESQQRTDERLAKFQQRTEKRLERLEAAVERLVEAQQHTDERLEQLTEAQQRTEERLERLEAIVERLAEAQQRTEERLEALIETVAEHSKTLADHTTIVGDLKGRLLELDYTRKAVAYFGSVLRRTQVYEHPNLADMLEPHLSPEEFKDALLIDLVVKGIPREHPELSEVLLAVEVSSVVDVTDVNRARRRAALIGQGDYRVIPVVAGEGITQGAEDRIQEHKVVLLQNGRVSQWEKALADLRTQAPDDSQ